MRSVIDAGASTWIERERGAGSFRRHDGRGGGGAVFEAARARGDFETGATGRTSSVEVGSSVVLCSRTRDVGSEVAAALAVGS